MSYAGNRRIIDVDSHVIELEDFLANAIDPKDRGLLPSMSDQKELRAIPAHGVPAQKRKFGKAA